MLTFLFFVSFFSSLVWLVYSGLFVHDRFVTVDISSVDAYSLALYAGLVVIPVWIIWQVFGFINQYFKTKSTDKKLEQLFTQMKKNQDYTDLVVRVMIDAEHEIKDGFVIGKFDVFVADMNEILADIAQRSNAASSVKIGELWARVKNGERWSIAKTFIENAKSRSDFETYLRDKAERDKIFRGTLMEFCARYQNLSNMLEKHDRDRVFITILQTGVMGRVYAMLAPIVFGSDNDENVDVSEELIEEEEPSFEASASIQQMEAPKEEKRDSVLTKMNPFVKKKKDKDKNKQQTVEKRPEEYNDDEFFSALHKSMTEPVEKPQKNVLLADNIKSDEQNEPHFDIKASSEKEDDAFLEEDEDYQDKTLQAFLAEPSTSQQDETDDKEDENLAYPFGGWTDAEK